MLAAIAAPHSLSPRGSTAAVHCPGAEIDTRPLQFNSQFTNEPIEMSSATCLSTNEPPSYTTFQDIRGHDPGAAANLAERPTLGHSPTIDNATNLRDDPTAHCYGAKGTGSADGYGACQELPLRPTTRAPLPGTIPQGGHDDHEVSWRDGQPSWNLSYSCKLQEVTQGCTVAALLGAPGLNCDNAHMTVATMCKSVLSNGEHDLAQTILASPHPSMAIYTDGLHTNAPEFAPVP
jgi:hypothetical protein